MECSISQKEKMENCVICAFVKKQYQNHNTERKFYCLKKHVEVNPLDSCDDFMDWREASWDDIKTIWEGNIKNE